MTAESFPIYDVTLWAPAAIPAAKVSAEELEELRERAVEHREEGPYFRALLDATVYAHAPISNDSGRVCFIQFPHPHTRKDTLPFFTDIEQAREVAQGQVKVLAMPGRLFFELSLGALLMLNPNRDAVMLYPEEIRTLLDSGQLDLVATAALQAPDAMIFGPPEHAPEWLANWLRSSLPQLPYVETAYLLDASQPENPAKVTVLIAVAVALDHFERAGRAISTLMQPRSGELAVSIDVLPYEPQGETAQWLQGSKVKPIYERPSEVRSFANNPLERMLQETRRDPARRKRLFPQLIESNVLVPVSAQHHGGGLKTLPAGTGLNVITMVRSDGVGVIPFFTSPARLYRWSLSGEQCVVMSVKELFESLSDMHFNLNPDSPDGQEFSPIEVRTLLEQLAKS